MEVPRHWRLKKQRYALVGKVCPHCAANIFPPRDVCPECGGESNRLTVESRKNGTYAVARMDRIAAG